MKRRKKNIFSLRGLSPDSYFIRRKSDPNMYLKPTSEDKETMTFHFLEGPKGAIVLPEAKALLLIKQTGLKDVETVLVAKCLQSK